MSADGRTLALDRMREAGVSQPAMDTFAAHYDKLAAGATGLIAESDVEPALPAVQHADLTVDEDAARSALDATVVITLNGGLGTSMGLAGPKSLLPVHEGLTFLDITVRQVLALRERYGVRLPLVLMDSFSTRDATLEVLGRYPELAVGDLPLDFLQSQEPKLREDDLTPVEWPADPRLEWCPPGHGDLYPSLLASGLLDRLLDGGYRFAFVSNVDNLGAVPDAALAAWFAGSGAGYAAEVCPRTEMDKKGGHLVRRRGDGRLVLRDTAQTAPEEMVHFMDADTHPYVNTNNLWFDLERLRAMLDERGGVLELPLIRNAKTVDPTDKASTPVIQIESAMGGAVELFEDAVSVGVTRERFAPVKTTNELLLLRSDVYRLDPRTWRLTSTVEPAPVVDLVKDHYGMIGDFDARFPAGPPSLVEASRLQVEGDWTFGADVRVVGAVTLGEEGGRVVDGTTLAPGGTEAGHADQPQ
ncbi:UTP--glucose-1-phosphate uridylyltransferase [Ornithinimicrobium cerasi]|uniref:UTP--glucose-1-phosphate uridylyltransferase n=1 Tax=Ornithinimicrobium cerasi TaxID=2248773 RepID=A0A285VC49_9MICO|nr:UTP--glucose-1-phosphate uridylyltransferase [Ornithinimicrobium cerasi]SOC51573.1 UTP--glucose-1-phosphate uridylyltransferase [Ornithinimicrobium cerasi]